MAEPQISDDCLYVFGKRLGRTILFGPDDAETCESFRGYDNINT